MKVLHVITGLGAGGAERMLTRIVTRGDRARFEHVVVSLTDEGVQGPVLADQGIRVVALGMSRGVPDLRGLLRLRRLIAAERPAVIQTWLYHADLLGLVAGRLAGNRAVAWNLRCSNMQLEHYSRLTRIVRRFLVFFSRFVPLVMVNSVAGRGFHEELGYRPRRWETIFNGFDMHEFRPDAAGRASVRAELGASADTPVIGMLARFDAMKDFATFFRAAQKLRNDFPHVHFLLAGQGVDAANAVLVEQSAALRNVHLLGFRSDVRALLSACDIFSLVSLSEGFPNVIGEAMACGVPCVATDAGDTTILIGDTGRVVPVGDADALAAAWRALLEMSAADRAALGAAARARIGRDFDLRSIVSRYESTYEGLVNGAYAN